MLIISIFFVYKLPIFIHRLKCHLEDLLTEFLHHELREFLLWCSSYKAFIIVLCRCLRVHRKFGDVTDVTLSYVFICDIVLVLEVI